MVTPPAYRYVLARSVGLAFTAVLSIWQTKLALFVLVLVLISAAALPKLEAKPRRFAWALHALAALLTLVGLLRFVVYEAVPGVVAAGERATGKQAVSKLRGLVVAQDTMRRFGYVDPDGDGIGSAVLIPELGGDVPMRGGSRLTAPMLNRELRGRVETPLGPAAAGGAYLYIVCLPAAGGGFTAKPGVPVDEELAERRYLAYAWPAAAAHGVHLSYFADQHERLLVFESDPNAPRYFGPERPPACDAALTEPGSWTPWQGKEPRKSLPGDR